MPIANCFVRGDVALESDLEDLTRLWSEESGIGEDHMTINLVAVTRQTGSAYKLMAVLFLPSLWTSEQVRRLQLGLARALCRAFALPLAQVHVIISIVESGHVVEGGEIQEW